MALPVEVMPNAREGHNTNMVLEGLGGSLSASGLDMQDWTKVSWKRAV